VSGAINCTPCELSIFLQELAAESSLTSSSGTAPSEPSRFESTARTCCCSESLTAFCPGSHSSQTYESSTDAHGEALWTSSTGPSPASPSPALAAGDEWPSTSGPSSGESSVSVDRGSCWPRTSSEHPSKALRGTSTPLAIRLPFASYPQPTWVPRINGDDGGSWLPTPTETANFDSPSMYKQWPGHQRMLLWTGGRTTATHIEFLMGWPLGWSDSAPLATVSFLSWRQQLGAFCGLSLVTDLMDLSLSELTSDLSMEFP